MSRYYTGPKSDHFDGERVFDPQGAPPRNRRDLLRWHLDRRWRAPKAKWPVWAPSPYLDRPPTRVQDTALRISYVGHASVLIQTAGLNILLDPVWSKRASPFHFAGPKRVKIQGSCLRTYPLSMSSWCRMDIIIILISRRFHGLRLCTVRALLRRSATTQ